MSDILYMFAVDSYEIGLIELYSNNDEEALRRLWLLLDDIQLRRNQLLLVKKIMYSENDELKWRECE